VAFHFGYWTVIEDDLIELTSGTPNVDRDVPFDLGDDITLRIGGVLTFMTDAVSPNSLTYRIRINNHNVIANRIVDSAVLHSEQQVVRAGNPLVLQHGINHLLITVTGGTGTLRISNIVFHYVRLS
jgi:hypothetical protein